MERVTSEQRLDELMNKDVIIYKHSTRCGISAKAIDEVEEFSEDAEIPVARINVIEDRELSDRVTERTRVSHESPQVILIMDGEPVDTLSQHRIRLSALKSMTENI